MPDHALNNNARAHPLRGARDRHCAQLGLCVGAGCIGIPFTCSTAGDRAVEAEIDRIEAQALERQSAPPDNQVQQIELLGKVMLYDKHLSVNRNEACAFCHMPQTGFTGPVSELNATTGAYPGSVRTRFSDRKARCNKLLHRTEVDSNSIFVSGAHTLVCRGSLEACTLGSRADPMKIGCDAD